MPMPLNKQLPISKKEDKLYADSKAFDFHAKDNILSKSNGSGSLEAIGGRSSQRKMSHMKDIVEERTKE